MTQVSQPYHSYKYTIWKFRRNLQHAAENKKLFPFIGDKEISISQNLADKVRTNPTVPEDLKKKVTQIHHHFVKFVWTL